MTRHLTSLSENGHLKVFRREDKSCSQYSNTRNMPSLFFPTTTSSKSTMLGCLHFFRTAISLNVVMGKPSCLQKNVEIMERPSSHLKYGRGTDREI